MKNKVNEWQELSLKKDIEKIRSIISQKQLIDYSLIFDFAIAVAALLLDILLSPESPSRPWLFWGLLALCLALLCWQIKIFGCEIIKKHNTKYRVYSAQELIDSFDNDICYYVMMADAYNQMLNDAVSQSTTGATSEGNKNNIALFYYIETWYYINKAKAKMSEMYYKTRQIFTKDTDEIARNNKQILLSRLVNIVMIMEDLRISTNCLLSNGKITLGDDSILSMNRKYDQKCKSFCDKINSDFGEIININFDDPTRFPQEST